MPPVILGYWDIRGLAQSIRYLLAYARVPYVDKRYSYGSETEPNRDEWLAVKHKLDFDFPNLPYLIDGDIRMTQSQAILRYLGRKHSLVPEDEGTLRRVDMLQHEAFDILWDTARLSYDPDYTEDKRRQFLTDVADRLHHLQVYLAKHGPYGAGNTVTYVDFMLYESFQVVKILGPTTFRKGYPGLEEYCDRIAALPGLQEYLASDKFKSWPIWSPFAKALSARSSVPPDDC